MNAILPIILLVSSVGLFMGYINPAYSGDTGSGELEGKSVKELQVEQGDYLDALNKTAEIERVRSGLSAKLNSISPTDIQKIGKLLPDHIDSVRLIIDINNLAQKYGMSLTNLVLTASGDVPVAQKAASSPAVGVPSAAGPSTPIGPDNSPYGSIKLGFTVTGSYDNFIQFLKEVEESLRIVDVTSLSFGTDRSKVPLLGQQQSSAPAPSPDAFTYSMTVRTYYLK